MDVSALRTSAFWLALAAGAGALLPAVGVSACSSSAAEVRYSGSEHPPVLAARDLEQIDAPRPPEGYRAIGVVRASCATLNGTPGLLGDDCSHEALTALLRDKAAAVGGHALIDVVCRNNVLERQVESRDAGGVATTVRAVAACEATVARRGAGGAPVKPAPPQGRRIELDGSAIAVHHDGVKAGPARSAADVGELEAFPEGYPRLGTVTAECLTACSRATARRALKQTAGQQGALAIAQPRCELLGQRWRCKATLVGEAETRDAG